jgi:cystathionine beta-lyase
VAAFGSERLQAQFAASPKTLRGGVSGFGLQGTLAAWRHGQPWLDAVLAQLDDNRSRVVKFAAEHLPGGKHPVPEATYLAWLDCRQLPVSNPYQFFLETARVALGNGEAFGPGGKGFVRLNFATSQNIITQIFQRMAAAVYELGRGGA